MGPNCATSDKQSAFISSFQDSALPDGRERNARYLLTSTGLGSWVWHDYWVIQVWGRQQLLLPQRSCPPSVCSHYYCYSLVSQESFCGNPVLSPCKEKMEIMPFAPRNMCTSACRSPSWGYQCSLLQPSHMLGRGWPRDWLLERSSATGLLLKIRPATLYGKLNSLKFWRIYLVWEGIRSSPSSKYVQHSVWVRCTETAKDASHFKQRL